MGDVGVICHTIYVSNLNEKIKKPLLKKSLHRCVLYGGLHPLSVLDSLADPSLA